MTTDEVDRLTDKISYLEKKIDRMIELLLLIVEEEYLSEEEKRELLKLIKSSKIRNLRD